MTHASSGGCQCGAVRYRVLGPLKDPHLCHCRMCQKAAGSYFMALGSVPRAAFALTRGEPAWFRSSGPVRRGFCAQCGTPLFLETDGSEKVYLTLGSLDDPAAVPPVSTYGTESRMPWLAEAVARPGPTTEEDEFVDGQRVDDIAASNRQHPDHDTDTWPPARR
ncbi:MULTISPECIES: GFA family protein [unclassified Roseitalea]|uniref:GFA family protein n=1 Tax=unclassified Roseitalea TaxID=2639107 RepID=UPI00273D8936|nr:MULTISPECIES: GFA family protein [unclassified Roseitalea]